MKQNRKEFIAGILLSVLLVGLLLFVHSRSVIKDSDEKFVLYAYFSKADGLMNGADVRLAGIKVGTVTHQSLNGRYAVRVRMSFDKPIEISTDSSVTIETDGLLGSKHIEIVPGGEEEMLVSGDDISYTQDALILSELMDKVMAYMREKKNKPEPVCQPCDMPVEYGEE
ncbi:MAG: MCE family protein [Alphaproteobacteria bacterium]|nr:MCE family protein [Alphaproteobacteria bacterium]